MRWMSIKTPLSCLHCFAPAGRGCWRQSPDGKVETMTVRCRSDIPAGTTSIRYAVRSDPKSVNPNQEDRHEEIYSPDIGQ